MKSTLLSIVAMLFAVASFAQPRAEYPRPQFERADWVNLNGEWSFTLDLANTGAERDYYNSKGFDQKILVPFAPESDLSGIGHKEFINAVWYQRTIQMPKAWEGKRVKLNFGAVYYESEVYIDGEFAMKLDTEVLLAHRFDVGREIDDDELKEIIEKSSERRAKEKALWLISYRSHSKKELFDKLARADGEEAAASAVEKIKTLGYIDDEHYAVALAKELAEKLFGIGRRACQTVVVL